MRNDTVQQALLKRLKRIEGQTAGLSRMVAEGRYCIDVIHQVRAVEAALHKVGELLLGNHLETCVTQAFASNNIMDRKDKIAELTTIYKGMRPR